MKRSSPTKNTASSHPPLEFVDATHVRVGRRTLLYFAGCNYLGLGRDPRVLAAMRNALEDGMVQPGASRGTTGEHPLYRAAEQAIARCFHQSEAALVPCGYLAPLAAVQALRSSCTQILLDDRTHACLRDAAALAGLPVTRFAHGNAIELRQRLRALPRAARPLVLADGVSGICGGLTPLSDYLAVLPKRGWLLVDDAHGAGTVGPGGRGTVAHFGLRDPRIVQTISLAKAIGVGGGAVLGPSGLIGDLRESAATFVGSTSMPLTTTAGVLASLRVMASEPQRIGRLQRNMKRLAGLLPPSPEVSISPFTPVTGIVPSRPARSEALRATLRKTGIYPSFIRYLSGPASGFFRLALSSEHTEADVERLANAVAAGLGAKA